jgi:hypothetical protein
MALFAESPNPWGRALGRLRDLTSDPAPLWQTVVAFGGTIAGFVRPLLGPSAQAMARRRSLRLLHENLAKDQLKQYSEQGFFDVIGGATGNRYRVAPGSSMNISQLDAQGRCTRRLCFFPQGALAEGDVLLAQKLALELFEREALAVANTFPAADGLIYRHRR